MGAKSTEWRLGGRSRDRRWEGTPHKLICYWLSFPEPRVSLILHRWICLKGVAIFPPVVFSSTSSGPLSSSLCLQSCFPHSLEPEMFSQDAQLAYQSSLGGPSMPLSLAAQSPSNFTNSSHAILLSSLSCECQMTPPYTGDVTTCMTQFKASHPLL